MKILFKLFTILFLFNMTTSCQQEIPNTSNSEELDELDLFNQNPQLNPLMLEKYENVVEQIKIDTEPLLYSDTAHLGPSRYSSGVFNLNTSLHHQVFQEIENDSNVIECKIWMMNPNDDLFIYYQNDNYPMDYIRSIIYEKDTHNSNHSEASVIPILRIFKKDFNQNELSFHSFDDFEKIRKKEAENLIAKHYNVLYIEKDWIEEDYFIMVTLFVKQNIDKKPKKVFN